MEPTDPTTLGLDPDLYEDMGARNQDSQHFRKPSDSRTTVTVISSNQHYRTTDGWEPQDLQFRLEGSEHVCRTHKFHTQVSDDGISVFNPDQGRGVKWLLNSRPAVSTRYAQLTSTEVDWVWGVGPNRLKLEGIVARRQGPTAYTFPYQPLGDTSDFRIVDGRAVADDITVAAPVIISANGLTYQAGGWLLLPGNRLSFNFDDSVLPDEAFPYTIDPTTTLQPSSGIDTYIDDGQPTTNHGSETAMFLGDANSAGANIYRCMLEFLLTDIASDQVVSSVIVNLWESGAADQGGVGPWDVTFHRVLQAAVQETESTWTIYSTGNNWASLGASTNGTDRVATASVTLSMDGGAAGAMVPFGSTAGLVSDVQGWVGGGANNGWLILATGAESGGTNANYHQIDCSDHGTASHRPQIIVVHGDVVPIPYIPQVILI